MSPANKNICFISSFLERYPEHILQILLTDRTTGKNIIWADSEYTQLGEGYAPDDQITISLITKEHANLIKPRVQKALEQQAQRTKSRAEVFTPSWLCNKMNNYLDAMFFNGTSPFNTEKNDGSWETSPNKVTFASAKQDKSKTWQSYIANTHLEITCGEAPFICSRYDTVTGEEIPVPERIGVLDRKLRIVGEHTKTAATWYKHALSALKATYGYEFQGDNLLIARINVFESFVEHFKDRWNEDLSDKQLIDIAAIISWNFWQMDGFIDAVPTNDLDAVVNSSLDSLVMEPVQASLFDLLDDEFTAIKVEEIKSKPTKATPLCGVRGHFFGQFLGCIS